MKNKRNVRQVRLTISPGCGQSALHNRVSISKIGKAGKHESRKEGKQNRRKAGKQESRKAGKPESRKVGKQESRKAGKQESRKAGKEESTPNQSQSRWRDLKETIDHAAPKNRFANNVCFCASRIMRSRTTYQIDPCTASAVIVVRKKSYSDTIFLVNHFIPSLFSFAILYLRCLASHYVGCSASQLNINFLSTLTTSYSLNMYSRKMKTNS